MLFKAGGGSTLLICSEVDTAMHMRRILCHAHTWLCEQGRLAKEDIDVRMCKALAELPMDQGVEAVDKFAAANLDTVRSKTGFMVGCPLSVSMVFQDFLNIGRL